MKTEHIIDWTLYVVDTIHFIGLVSLLSGMVYLLYKEIVNTKV